MKKLKQKKKVFYYILAGTNDLKDKLEQLGIYTSKLYLFKVKPYSKLYKMIRKEVLGELKWKPAIITR